MLQARIVLLSVLFATRLACTSEAGGSPDADPSECQPGATRLCYCTRYLQGLQICVDPVVGWGGCKCAEPPSSAGPEDDGVAFGLEDADATVAPDEANEAGPGPEVGEEDDSAARDGADSLFETSDGSEGGEAGPGADAGGEDDTGPEAPLRCVLDSDCGDEGAVCSCDGACIVPATAPCASDASCGPGEHCDACERVCEPDLALCDPCGPGSRCTDQGLCLDFEMGGSFCGARCTADTDCPNGFRCDHLGYGLPNQCVPLSGDCGNLGVCATDADCRFGETCNAFSKMCQPGCEVTATCAGSLVCDHARCKKPCNFDNDCTAGKICNFQGLCRAPGECDEPADCPQYGTYCDKGTGLCTPGCRDDVDCGPLERCSERQCVPATCAHHGDCPFGEVCRPESGTCVPAELEGQCDACNLLEPETCGAGTCVELEVDSPSGVGEPASLGTHCLMPCDDDLADPCPQGYACTLYDPWTPVGERYFCSRACTLPPVGSQ